MLEKASNLSPFRFTCLSLSESWRHALASLFELNRCIDEDNTCINEKLTWKFPTWEIKQYHFLFKKWPSNSRAKHFEKVKTFSKNSPSVYLSRFLTSKRRSASGLNCKYLNPYIKLKLIELAIKLHQECLTVEFFLPSLSASDVVKA